METKVCSKCGMELPLEMFHKNSKSPDGRQSICKNCKSEYSKSKLQERKEKVATANAEAAKLPSTADTIQLPNGTVLRKVETVADILAKIQSVDLFAELKRRGYQWEERAIWRKQYVEYRKIEV